MVFHFALPFGVLLSRDIKRSARTLALVAVALLVVRVVDVVWLVAPAFGRTGLAVHVLHVAAVVGIGGLWLAVFVTRLARRPLVPLHDPSLQLTP